MRILMLTHNPVGKGADFWRAFYLGRQLAQMGRLVTLVCSPAADENQFPDQIAGFSIRAIPEGSRSVVGRAGYSPIEVAERLLQLRGDQFDLIHTFGHRPAVSWVARWLMYRLHSLQVADWSDLWGIGGIADERRPAGRLTIGLADHWLERQNILAADGVAVVSRFLQRRAQAWGKSPEQVLRLGVGAAVDVIKPVPKHQARAMLGIASDQHVFAHSGQSAFDRAHIQAVCRQILLLDPGSSILLLGEDPRFNTGTSGGESGNRVHRLGHLNQEQMGIALGACDAVLLPLRNRGFNKARLPNRVGDAAAAGRPIATNPTGDVGELVRDEGLGIVVDEDPPVMAAAVVDLTKDQEMLAELGQRARDVAETKFSWALRAEQLVSFYGRLLSR